MALLRLLVLLVGALSVTTSVGHTHSSSPNFGYPQERWDPNGMYPLLVAGHQFPYFDSHYGYLWYSQGGLYEFCRGNYARISELACGTPATTWHEVNPGHYIQVAYFTSPPQRIQLISDCSPVYGWYEGRYVPFYYYPARRCMGPIAWQLRFGYGRPRAVFCYDGGRYYGCYDPLYGAISITLNLIAHRSDSCYRLPRTSGGPIHALISETVEPRFARLDHGDVRPVFERARIAIPRIETAMEPSALPEQMVKQIESVKRQRTEVGLAARKPWSPEANERKGIPKGETPVFSEIKTDTKSGSHRIEVREVPSPSEARRQFGTKTNEREETQFGRSQDSLGRKESKDSVLPSTRGRSQLGTPNAGALPSGTIPSRREPVIRVYPSKGVIIEQPKSNTPSRSEPELRTKPSFGSSPQQPRSSTRSGSIFGGSKGSSSSRSTLGRSPGSPSSRTGTTQSKGSSRSTTGRSKGGATRVTGRSSGRSSVRSSGKSSNKGGRFRNE